MSLKKLGSRNILPVLEWDWIFDDCPEMIYAIAGLSAQVFSSPERAHVLTFIYTPISRQPLWDLKT